MHRLWVSLSRHTQSCDVYVDFRDPEGELQRPCFWFKLPIDWSRPNTWGVVVATPVTATLDVFIFGPIHVAWIFGTAGGHGTPWCGICD